VAYEFHFKEENREGWICILKSKSSDRRARMATEVYSEYVHLEADGGFYRNGVILIMHLIQCRFGVKLIL